MATSLLRSFSNGVFGAAFIALGTVTTPSYATTISLDQTFGNDMAGIEVTADFLSGESETATWSVTGSEAGGAFGTDWSVTQSGETFFDPWTFSNSGQSIAFLEIKAIPGNTAFDTIYSIEEPPNTPGSALGIPFTVLTGPPPDSFAYSDEIDISEGDLFGTLSVNYNNGFTGTITYRADTDNGTQNDPVAVPESSGLLSTLTVGTLGAGLRLLRRQKQKA